MIDVRGIEYDFLPSVLWMLGVFLTGVVILIWSYRREGKSGEMPLFSLGLTLTLGSLILGIPLVIGIQASDYVNNREYQLVDEQLSDQGFSRVDLDWEGKTFTASLDGQYFEGLLRPVGDYKYQVLEVGEVKP